MSEEKDQVLDETQEGNSSEEQSTEATEEQGGEEITTERAYELAKGLQKGYTLTRQELAEVRENLSAIQEALNELRSSGNEFDEFGDLEEKPLTKKDLVEVLAELENKKASEQAKKEAMVDSMIEDLKMEGVVKDDAEADELIKFVVNSAKTAGLKEVSPQYILSLVPAWTKIKEAEQVKAQVKSKTKIEEGSKVGTSEKTKTGDNGISYADVHNKDWDEL